MGELRTELQALRVTQVTGGAAAKLSKIKLIRKAIARCLTVINTCTKRQVRNQCSTSKAKYLPLDLRKKTTRKMRRMLTLGQQNKMTMRQKKKVQAFPRRKYALATA